MTDNETVELGSFIKTIGSTGHFAQLKVLFEQSLADELLTTAPHEKNRREGIYDAILGFRQFVSFLDNIVERADALTNDEDSD